MHLSQATRLIFTITKLSYPQIRDLTRNPGHEGSRCYHALANLFNHTHKVYSGDAPFINATEMRFFNSTQQEIVR